MKVVYVCTYKYHFTNKRSEMENNTLYNHSTRNIKNNHKWHWSTPYLNRRMTEGKVMIWVLTFCIQSKKGIIYLCQSVLSFGSL